MSNFQSLLENEELIFIAEEVFKESCKELIQILDEPSIEKIEEYVSLLSNKKIKKSLECEISESLFPILEKNTILYGTFLYETQPIQENVNFGNEQLLTNIRENSDINFIIDAMSLNEQTRNSKSNIAKKTGIGLGVAGAAGAGSVYAAGKKSLKDAQNKYDDSNIVKRWISGPRPEDDGVKSTMKRGLGYMKNKSDDVKGTMKKGASYVKDKYDEVTD